jgi:hypothetical protein
LGEGKREVAKKYQKPFSDNKFLLGVFAAATGLSATIFCFFSKTKGFLLQSLTHNCGENGDTVFY